MDPMEYPDINMAFDEYKLFQPLTDTSIDENQLNIARAIEQQLVQAPVAPLQNQNDILVTVDDLNVLQKDIESLHGNNLLTDTIILAYMKSFKINSLYVLSSNIATQIVNSGKLLNIIRKNLSSYQYIAGPVHIPEKNHWCLLFISMNDNQVIYIDPYQATKEKLNEVLANWGKFCKTRTGLKSKEWKLSPYSSSHTKQIDSYSCGVFVSYFFEKLIKSEFNYLQNFFDVNDYRMIIKSKIIC